MHVHAVAALLHKYLLRTALADREELRYFSMVYFIFGVAIVQFYVAIFYCVVTLYLLHTKINFFKDIYFVIYHFDHTQFLPAT
jgi:hypothetical protein